jgi:hypothetical protein
MTVTVISHTQRITDVAASGIRQDLQLLIDIIMRDEYRIPLCLSKILIFSNNESRCLGVKLRGSAACNALLRISSTSSSGIADALPINDFKRNKILDRINECF